MRSILYVIIFLFVVSLVVAITPISWFDKLAVDGSFGIRPKTHKCVGFIAPASTTNQLLPQGDVSFPLIFGKKFVYNVQDNSRDYCVGQDIWFGE